MARRQSSPGHLAYRASNPPTELPSHLDDLDIYSLIHSRTTKVPMRHALFDARGLSCEPTLSCKISQGRKKSWHDRDSNPVLLAYRANKSR